MVVGYACSGTTVDPLKHQAVHRPQAQQPEPQQKNLEIQAVHQPQNHKLQGLKSQQRDRLKSQQRDRLKGQQRH